MSPARRPVMRRARRLVLGLAALAMLAAAASAFACPVCYGESNDPIVKGAQASMLFMAVLTYLLLGTGVVSFLLLRRRARRLVKLATATISNP